MEYDYNFKIHLVGPARAGKSCLVLKFADGLASEAIHSGAAYRLSTLILKDFVIAGEKVRLQLWHQNLRHSAYYRSAQAVFVCVDMGNPSTLDELPTFLTQARSDAREAAAIFLVGCKADLSADTICTAKLKKIATEHGLTYLETSAKNNVGVTEAFMGVAGQLIIEKLNQQISEVQIKLTQQAATSATAAVPLFARVAQILTPVSEAEKAKGLATESARVGQQQKLREELITLEKRLQAVQEAVVCLPSDEYSVPPPPYSEKELPYPSTSNKM